LVAADKAGKAEFIEIMNSEIIQGRIKVIDTIETEPLREEWGSLIWDERAKKREEHPACENHLSDSCLYAWRDCYQYLSEVPKVDNRTLDDKMDEHEELLSEKLKQELEQPFWERDWG
jgi:hypothetical protein